MSDYDDSDQGSYRDGSGSEPEVSKCESSATLL